MLDALVGRGRDTRDRGDLQRRFPVRLDAAGSLLAGSSHGIPEAPDAVVAAIREIVAITRAERR